TAAARRLTDEDELPRTPAQLGRCILGSLAETYRDELRAVCRLAGVPLPSRLHVVGGGSRNALLNRLTADALGIEVLAAPMEATALGSVAPQARTPAAVGAQPGTLRELVRPTVQPASVSPSAAPGRSPADPGPSAPPPTNSTTAHCEGTPRKRRQLPQPRELLELMQFKAPDLNARRRRLSAALTIEDLRAIAKRRTPRAAFDYTDGAAESELS